MITRSLKAGDILITTPIEYATDGQQLTLAVDGKAPPAPKGQRPGKGRGKNGPMKGKKGKGSGSKKGTPAA